MDVEILPWAHDYALQEHKDLVDYVLSLPKGSTLALEISPGQIEIMQAIETLLQKRKITWKSTNLEAREVIKKYIFRNRFGLFKHSLTPGELALFELYHVAKKRDLKLVPLDTMVSRATKAHFSQEKSYSFREETFAKLIKQQKPNSKIFAVVGMMHADGLNRQLQEFEINSRINFGYLNNPKAMKKAFEMYLAYKEALKKKKWMGILTAKHEFDHASLQFVERKGWKAEKKELFNHYKPK